MRPYSHLFFLRGSKCHVLIPKHLSGRCAETITSIIFSHLLFPFKVFCYSVLFTLIFFWSDLHTLQKLLAISCFWRPFRDFSVNGKETWESIYSYQLPWYVFDRWMLKAIKSIVFYLCIEANQSVVKIYYSVNWMHFI